MGNVLDCPECGSPCDKHKPKTAAALGIDPSEIDFCRGCGWWADLAGELVDMTDDLTEVGLGL